MEDTCCARFDPEPWDEKELQWSEKQFVKDRVRSFLHIPLNFGDVMVKNMKLIEAAGAEPDHPIVLSDENSLWGADLYINVIREVPGARMTTVSGNFISKVFEGPYSKVRSWISEMLDYVGARGRASKKFYFYYTTCPKCAKKYGKNYVVILAQV